MRINHVRQYIDYTLLLLVCFTSCNGQVKTHLPNTDTGNSKIIKTQGSDQYQNICTGLEDKAGNLWFGTSGEGVYRYDGKLFTQFTIQNGLNSNTLRSVIEDKKGNIWLATNKGICCYDGKIMKEIPISLNMNYKSGYYTNNNPVYDVFCIMQDRKGMLWFGTSHGVLCYNGSVFTSFTDNHALINDSNLTLKNVQCIFEDKTGNIWFGSGPMAFEGLCLFDGKCLKKFNPEKQVWIRKITEDKNGRLLIVTRSAGVLAYNRTDFASIPKPIGLRNDLLNYFLVTSKGNSWYASDYVNDNDITTGGLWQSNGNSAIEFTKKDGLKNTSVTFILEDRYGNIWTGTRNNVLYRYDGKSFTAFSE